MKAVLKKYFKINDKKCCGRPEQVCGQKAEHACRAPPAQRHTPSRLGPRPHRKSRREEVVCVQRRSLEYSARQIRHKETEVHSHASSIWSFRGT
jgi:hypothetical protein